MARDLAFVIHERAEPDRRGGVRHRAEAPHDTIVLAEGRRAHRRHLRHVSRHGEKAAALHDAEWLTDDARPQRLGRGGSKEPVDVDAHRVVLIRSAAQRIALSRKYTRSTFASPRMTSPLMTTPLVRTLSTRSRSDASASAKRWAAWARVVITPTPRRNCTAAMAR